MVLGCAVTGRLKRFAFWFALALVGQAVALQMIEAGPLIHYQHYKPFDRLLTGTHPLLLIYLAVQSTLVAAGLRTRWPSIRAWTGRSFNVWQLLGVGLVFFLSSATVSREVWVYVAELFFAAFVQTVNLGNIVLMVWALPEEALGSLTRRLERLFGRLGKEPDLSFPKGDVGESGGVDRFAVVAAIWVTVLSAVLSVYSYERHPHIPDEVVYLYHARYFAGGMLTAPAPPVPEAFGVYLMGHVGSRWHPSTLPGWPVMLALGVLFGVPWLVNPALAGLNVLLSHLLLREMYDRHTARLALLLLCLSPWHIFMAMNFMSHTFVLTCSLAAAVAVSWARKTGKAVWGLVGGFAVGMVSLIRPLDGLVVAGLLGLWAIGFGGRRLKVTSIVAFVLGSIVMGAAVLPYNTLLTGDPTVFPLNAYLDRRFGPGRNDLGFGANRGFGWPLDPFPGHSPLEALINADLNIFSLNIELFGWSTGSVIMMSLLVFSGAMRRSDYLMLTLITATLGVYSLYWFSGGPDFGARYWYLMLVPCVALTVRGIQFLGRLLEAWPAGSTVKGGRVMVGVLSLCLLTLVNYFPWRAIDKYHSYLRMRPDIRYLAKEYSFGKSLVLIRGNSHPDYASAWIYNPLDLHADAPVYAWDRNPEVRALVLKAYADRPVWLVNGPSITNGGFRVIAGPLPAYELITKESGVQESVPLAIP